MTMHQFWHRNGPSKHQQRRKKLAQSVYGHDPTIRTAGQRDRFRCDRRAAPGTDEQRRQILRDTYRNPIARENRMGRNKIGSLT